MDDKKQMQNEELEHVSGGSANGNTRCCSCMTVFYGRTAENRNVKDGCETFYVYKCPNCGKWVKDDGTVYKG